MKKIFKILGIIMGVLIIGSWIYIGNYYHADTKAIEALESSETITVKEGENSYIFVPEQTVAGMIFYPGGKVEYTAYAPLMKAYTEQGIQCFLLKMPGNLAVLDMDAAEGIQEQYPEIDTWYMAGHSLGGSMAANYIANHVDEFEGLILLASYSTKDLSETELDVISIYGSEDGVLNMEKYKEYRENLPKDTRELVIEGGCHAYFGSYGAQEGDGAPAITMEEQIQEAVNVSVHIY